MNGIAEADRALLSGLDVLALGEPAADQPCEPMSNPKVAHTGSAGPLALTPEASSYSARGPGHAGMLRKRTKDGTEYKLNEQSSDSQTGERERGAYEYGFFGLGERERGVRGEERESGEIERDEKTVGGRAEGWQPHPSRSRSWGVSDHHLQRGRAGGMSGWRHRHGGRQQAAARAI